LLFPHGGKHFNEFRNGRLGTVRHIVIIAHSRNSTDFLKVGQRQNIHFVPALMRKRKHGIIPPLLHNATFKQINEIMSKDNSDALDKKAVADEILALLASNGATVEDTEYIMLRVREMARLSPVRCSSSSLSPEPDSQTLQAMQKNIATIAQTLVNAHALANHVLRSLPACSRAFSWKVPDCLKEVVTVPCQTENIPSTAFDKTHI
jgi:hypothetical protein